MNLLLLFLALFAVYNPVITASHQGPYVAKISNQRCSSCVRLSDGTLFWWSLRGQTSRGEFLYSLWKRRMLIFPHRFIISLFICPYMSAEFMVLCSLLNHMGELKQHLNSTLDTGLRPFDCFPITAGRLLDSWEIQ